MRRVRPEEASNGSRLPGSSGTAMVKVPPAVLAAPPVPQDATSITDAHSQPPSQRVDLIARSLPGEDYRKCADWPVCLLPSIGGSRAPFLLDREEFVRCEESAALLSVETGKT
ncbi:hypothetical protein GCM10023075_36100 [Streptosporangium album]